MNSIDSGQQFFSSDNLWHPNRAIPIIDWFIMSGASFDETTFPHNGHFDLIHNDIQYSVGKPTEHWDTYCVEIAALVGQGLPFDVELMEHLVEVAMEQTSNDGGRITFEVGDEDGTCVWLVRRLTASELTYGFEYTMILLRTVVAKLSSALASI